MSRALAVKLIGYLKKHRRVIVKQVAIDLKTEESNVREWFYALRAEGLIRRSGEHRRRPAGGGLHPKYWEWVE